MTRLPAPQRGALLALVLVLAASTAWAEPVSRAYSWSASPGVVPSDDGTGRATFTPAWAGPLCGSHASGPGILAATLDATAPASGSATWTNQGYGLTMHLTDNASHATGDLTFSGAFVGSL